MQRILRQFAQITHKRTAIMLTRAGGFTQFELLIALGIIAILAAFAVPSFQSIQERNQVIAAAEALSADLRWARSEALKQGVNVSVAFTPGVPVSVGGSGWQYVIATSPPSPATATTLKTTSSTSTPDFYNISMTNQSSNGTTFNSTHGTAGAGSVAFVSHYQSYELAVILSVLGRVSICSCLKPYRWL